jgi:hypothetical protein
MTLVATTTKPVRPVFRRFNVLLEPRQIAWLRARACGPATGRGRGTSAFVRQLLDTQIEAEAQLVASVRQQRRALALADQTLTAAP